MTESVNQISLIDTHSALSLTSNILNKHWLVRRDYTQQTSKNLPNASLPLNTIFELFFKDKVIKKALANFVCKGFF
jgi:hypothetical protein